MGIYSIYQLASELLDEAIKKVEEPINEASTEEQESQESEEITKESPKSSKNLAELAINSLPKSSPFLIEDPLVNQGGVKNDTVNRRLPKHLY